MSSSAVGSIAKVYEAKREDERDEEHGCENDLDVLVWKKNCEVRKAYPC